MVRCFGRSLCFCLQCWCGGDSFSVYGQITNGLCSDRCSGDAAQICGGFYALSVYSTAWSRLDHKAWCRKWLIPKLRLSGQVRFMHWRYDASLYIGDRHTEGLVQHEVGYFMGETHVEVTRWPQGTSMYWLWGKVRDAGDKGIAMFGWWGASSDLIAT